MLGGAGCLEHKKSQIWTFSHIAKSMKMTDWIIEVSFAEVGLRKKEICIYIYTQPRPDA